MDFEKQGKNIYDFYLEKQDEYLELNRYDSMVNDYIFWTRRKEFVLCMENYVHDSIDFEHFEIAFSRLWEESMEEYTELEIDVKGLKNFELDPKSDEFCRSVSVTVVYRYFEMLEDEECTEQEVKDSVRDALREIRQYL
jgi:hypothetical protein